MRIQWQTGYSYNTDKELLTAGRRQTGAAEESYICLWGNERIEYHPVALSQVSYKNLNLKFQENPLKTSDTTIIQGKEAAAGQLSLHYSIDLWDIWGCVYEIYFTHGTILKSV